VIQTDIDRSATCDFLLTLRGNYGPISYCFRDKRRIQSQFKSQFFPISCVFYEPAEGVTLVIG